MIKLNGSFTNQRHWPFLYCLLAMALLLPLSADAQSYVGVENIALGSGGTAYLDGPEASFANPANLMIYDRQGTVNLTLGEGATFFQPVLSTKRAGEQWQNYRNQFTVYRPGSQSITDDERSTLVRENYPRNRLVSQHQNRSEVLLGGVSWMRGDNAYSLALRSRTASRTEVGRGWYASNFTDTGTENVRDFTLTRQTQTFHELSFGYAQEFSFFNGFFATLNRLYIGIAPKFVMGGAYSSSEFTGYLFDEENPQFRRKFDHQSTGNYSEAVNNYRQNNSAEQAINQHLENPFILDPTGYGGGIDFGLSYVIPLESNTAILDRGADRRTLGRSLRFAFSITDLGLIRYHDTPLELNMPTDTLQAASPDPTNTKFIGSPGQYFTFFDNNSPVDHPYLEAENSASNSFLELLPTSLNGGFLLDLNRVKFNGDLTLGLHNTAFNSTRLTAHFGAEIHPHPNIPIRVGTQLAARQPVHFGFGTGYEHRNWDVYLSGQVLIKSTLTTELTGGGLAGLRFHL